MRKVGAVLRVRLFDDGHRGDAGRKRRRIYVVVRKVRAPFEDADREDDFSGLVDYLDNLQRIPVVAEVKDWIVASVAERDPHAIAEIGCGNGDMSARFARACPDSDY